MDHPKPTPERAELNRALNALCLEVDSAIVGDVQERIEKAIEREVARAREQWTKYDLDEPVSDSGHTVRDLYMQDAVVKEAVARAVEPLVALLGRADVVMDTAALHGVRNIMPPEYAEHWAETHQAMRALLVQYRKGE